MRRFRAAWAGVAVAVLLAGGISPASAALVSDAGTSGPPAADTSEVDALTARLADAVAAEEAALLGLAAGVQASVAAQTATEQAAAVAGQARARQTRTVRALYSSGGELAIIASVLGSGSLDELADRQQMVRTVLSSAAADSRAAATSSAAAVERAAAADAQVRAQLTTAADVATATAAVERTLADARARLHAANEEAVRRWAAAEAAAAAARRAATVSAAGSVTAVGIPATYQTLYEQAAQTCPGLRWTMLAAVGQVESGHGQNTGPSSAGAIGPMQFMPRTFAAYGVDGDGDGIADAWSPADAIFSAARYLCASGAGQGTPESDRRALLRYNNAQWYVDLVLGVERDLVARVVTP